MQPQPHNETLSLCYGLLSTIPQYQLSKVVALPLASLQRHVSLKSLIVGSVLHHYPSLSVSNLQLAVHPRYCHSKSVELPAVFFLYDGGTRSPSTACVCLSHFEYVSLAFMLFAEHWLSDSAELPQGYTIPVQYVLLRMNF